MTSTAVFLPLLESRIIFFDAYSEQINNHTDWIVIRPSLNLYVLVPNSSSSAGEMHPFMSSKTLSPSTPNLSVIVGQPRERESKQRSKGFFGRPTVLIKEPNAVTRAGFRGRDEHMHRTGTRNESVVYRGNVVRVHVPRYVYTIRDNILDEFEGDRRKVSPPLENDEVAERSEDGFQRMRKSDRAFLSSTFRFHSDPNILASYSLEDDLSDSSTHREEFLPPPLSTPPPPPCSLIRSTIKEVVLRKVNGIFGFVLCGAKSDYRNVSAFRFSPTHQIPALQYMERVDRGSSAERAGLKVGDFLLQVNGTNVMNATHERTVQLIKESGENIRLKILTTSAAAAAAAAASEERTRTDDASDSFAFNDDNHQRAHNIGRHMDVRIVKLWPFKSKATKDGRHSNGTLKTNIPRGQNGLSRSGADPRRRASPPPSQLFRVRHPEVTPKWSGSHDNNYHHDKYLNTPDVWFGCYGDGGSRAGSRPLKGWGNGMGRKSSGGTGGVVCEGSSFQWNRKTFRNEPTNSGVPLFLSYSLEDVTVPSFVPPDHSTNPAAVSKVRRRLFGSAEVLLDGSLSAPLQETTYKHGGFLNKYQSSLPSFPPLSFRPPALPPLQRKKLGRDEGGSAGIKRDGHQAQNSLLRLQVIDNLDESSSSLAISPSTEQCLADKFLPFTDSDHHQLTQPFKAAPMSLSTGELRNAKDDQNSNLIVDAAASPQFPLVVHVPISTARSWNLTPTDSRSSTDNTAMQNEMTSVADNTLDDILVGVGPRFYDHAVDANASVVATAAAAAVDAFVSMETEKGNKDNGNGSSLLEIETGEENKHWETGKEQRDHERCDTVGLDAKDSVSEKNAGGESAVCSGPTDFIRDEVLIQVNDQHSTRNDLRKADDGNHLQHILTNSNPMRDVEQRCNTDMSATARQSSATTISAAATLQSSSSTSSAVIVAEEATSNNSLKDVAGKTAGKAKSGERKDQLQRSEEDEERLHLRHNDRVSKSPKEVVNFLELAESARQQYLQRKREAGRRNQSQTFWPEKSERKQMLSHPERGKTTNPYSVPFVEWNQTNRPETRILKTDDNDKKSSERVFPIDRSGLKDSRTTVATEPISLNGTASVKHEDSWQTSTGIVAVAVAAAVGTSAIASDDRKEMKQNQRYCVGSVAETGNRNRKVEASLEGGSSGFCSSRSAALILGNGDNTKPRKSKKEIPAADQTIHMPKVLNESAAESTDRNPGFPALKNRKQLTRVMKLKPLLGGSHLNPATSSTPSSVSSSTSSCSSSAPYSDYGHLETNDTTQTRYRTPIQISSETLKPKSKSPIPLIQNMNASLGSSDNKLRKPVLESSGSSEIIIPPPIEFRASAATTNLDGSTAGKIHERKPASTPGTKLEKTPGITSESTQGTVHGRATAPGSSRGATLGSVGLPDNKARISPQGTAPVATLRATSASTDNIKPGIKIGKTSECTYKRVNGYIMPEEKSRENVGPQNIINGSTNGGPTVKLPTVVREGISGVKLDSSTSQTPGSQLETMAGDVTGKRSRLAAQRHTGMGESHNDIRKNRAAIITSTPKPSNAKAPSSKPIVAADSVQTFISITPQYIHLPPSV